MHKHWRRHTNTHQNRLTRLMPGTWYKHNSRNTSGGDSEFSVNMHALWLKHLNFPLVPYHTVLHSACSSNCLIGPIIVTAISKKEKKKSRKQQSHPLIVRVIYLLRSREEMNRDTNTSESKGWNWIGHFDWMSHVQHDMTTTRRHDLTKLRTFVEERNSLFFLFCFCLSVTVQTTVYTCEFKKNKQKKTMKKLKLGNPLHCM